MKKSGSILNKNHDKISIPRVFATVKISLSTVLTVRDTPSTDTEPLEAKYFKKSLFILKVILNEPLIFSINLIKAVVSTCP